MSYYSPPMSAPGEKDAGHVRLLSIFHYVFAGLGILGLGMLAAHFAFMRWMFTNPAFMKSQPNNAPPPKEIMVIFTVMYSFCAVLIVAGMVLNILSARFMAKRKNRIFSLVVAGIDCLQFPFGTTLGVFTFIVLLRDSVRQLYDSPSR